MDMEAIANTSSETNVEDEKFYIFAQNGLFGESHSVCPASASAILFNFQEVGKHTIIVYR